MQEPLENPLQNNPKNSPLASVGHGRRGANRRRRYTKRQQVIELAQNKSSKKGEGTTFVDLMSAGIAFSKTQAQETLKYLMEKKVLFTLKDQRPQRYYPACMKAKVIDSIAKRENAPVKPTGVNSFTSPIQNLLRQQSSQSFLDILLSLPKKPLYIHKLQLQTSITREAYNDIHGKIISGNRAKPHNERIGNSLVTFLIYPNGKVMVSIACSNWPFKVESDTDEINLFSFFGQVRDRLINILSDSRECMVPLVTDWFLIHT